MEDELLSLIRQRDKQNATLKHEINNLLTTPTTKVVDFPATKIINPKNYFPNTQLLTNIFTKYYKFFNIKFGDLPIK